MKPFENDELSDRELDVLLRAWEVPQAPARLHEAVFGPPPRTRWRALLGGSIRVPVPLAVAAALVLALAIWKWPRQVEFRDSPPHVETKTVRVEVPVVKKEIVTRVIYRDRSPHPSEEGSELRRVEELRPRIIRSRYADN